MSSLDVAGGGQQQGKPAKLFKLLGSVPASEERYTPPTGSNAKKSDGERLEVEAEARRRREVSKVVGSSKSARASAVGLRRFGLDGERARVVDVDVGRSQRHKKDEEEKAEPVSGGVKEGEGRARAEVFDECDEEDSSRLGRVAASMGAGGAVLCNGVPMESSRAPTVGAETDVGEGGGVVAQDDDYMFDYYWVDPASQLDAMREARAGGDAYKGYARVAVDMVRLTT